MINAGMRLLTELQWATTSGLRDSCMSFSPCLCQLGAGCYLAPESCDGFFSNSKYSLHRVAEGAGAKVSFAVSLMAPLT